MKLNRCFNYGKVPTCFLFINAISHIILHEDDAYAIYCFVCYLTKLDLYRGEPGVQCWLDAWLGMVQIRTILHVFFFVNIALCII